MRKKVFVVDDDKIFHFIIKKLLLRQEPAPELVFFENGLDAIERLKQKLETPERFPDIILLDINMPVLDGWQFLEEFRAIRPKMSRCPEIYLVSSSDNVCDRDRAREYSDEICDYYLKPMGHEEVCKIFLN